jgi:hypothetical protein
LKDHICRQSQVDLRGGDIEVFRERIQSRKIDICRDLRMLTEHCEKQDASRLTAEKKPAQAVNKTMNLF